MQPLKQRGFPYSGRARDHHRASLRGNGTIHKLPKAILFDGPADYIHNTPKARTPVVPPPVAPSTYPSQRRFSNA
jgi:hypothetical protein